jgi:hypothetical protein
MTHRTLADILREVNVAPQMQDTLARIAYNMGVRWPSVGTTASVGALASNGAESLIMTTPPLNLTLDFAQVLLLWWFTGNSGNSTTALNPKIRRGAALTSALVNVGNAIAVTAASQVSLSGCYIDTPGAVAAQQYSLTLTGTATTGVGTFLDGCMIALSL